MTILEQLWHGTLRPAEIKKPPTSRYNDLLDAADETEKKLFFLLTDEGKELYQKIGELRMELYDTENFRIFAKGFHTGAKLMLEIMENEKAE
ncbi:MAG: hypothetical protein J1F60_08375 [Oscillospiraceae bacterium]|nr:hypothetical protein [Oscillospiraceae bacterium]